MSKISQKISLPIILSALFAITIFIAVDYQRMNVWLYMLILFLAIAVFFFGYSMGEQFASPIRDLLKRASKMTNGYVSDRIYLNTKDEIEELAKIFNKLAEELEQTSQKQQNTEKSVDMKVRAKTQALQETINALEQKVQNRTIELERLSKELAACKGQPSKPKAPAQAPVPTKKVPEIEVPENENA